MTIILKIIKLLIFLIMMMMMINEGPIYIYYSTFGYFTNYIGTKIKKRNNLVVGNLETMKI